MVGKVFIFFVVICFAFANGFAQKTKTNVNPVVLEANTLAENKVAIATGTSALIPSYKLLLKTADELLSFQPVSVMDKMEIPPSGDKHDYMSIAPYWWPDSSKKNGLPYIRKDGITNPETKNYPDKNNMPKLCENIYLLSLAYYYSDKKVYAKQASKLIEVWFLDKKTKMNPNLNYSQFIKGVNDGRGAGIIDSRHFIYVIDAVNLLKTSKDWTKKNEVNMQQWFKDLLLWLETSKNGMEEKSALNNHGVWYEAQAITIAVYMNDIAKAKEIIERATKKLDVEMDEKGFFPLELDRTIALHYSTFILDAFYIIAQQAEKINIDFWKVQTASGKSLQKGLDAIYPYITLEKLWIGKQIKDYVIEDGFPLLIKSAGKLNCKSCYDSLVKLVSNKNILYYLF